MPEELEEVNGRGDGEEHQENYGRRKRGIIVVSSLGVIFLKGLASWQVCGVLIAGHQSGRMGNRMFDAANKRRHDERQETGTGRLKLTGAS